MRYHGEEAEFSLRHALAWQGSCSSSWCSRSTGRASSPTTSRTTARACTTSASTWRITQRAVAEALRAGFVPLQSARGFGAEGDGAFAYFQAPGVAMIVELIEAPRVRIEPEFVYYPPTAG